MKGRKKKAAPPPETATPFFARFLEDQHGGDAEAKVSASPARAQATTKKSGGARKKAAIPAQTLKYPSDRDEWVLYPYHVSSATIKGGGTRQTLKYPSDRDEDIDPYVPVYINAADVPKATTAKPKKGAKIGLTTKAADIDRVAS
jgi:hypothetical protein